jgi:S-DNA-T family DNA segregation ATPase FtsK/SpoIIIE
MQVTMRRVAALVLCSALIIQVAMLRVSAHVGFELQAQAASLAGTATSNTGQVLANYTVQLRNLATGQLAGTTTSSTTGAFSFGGLQAGNFAVEVVNVAGQIVGTSASVTVAAGATITGVTVSASAAAIAGAAGAAAAAGAAGGAAGLSTAAIATVVTAATTAGVGAAVALNEPASGSR